MKALEALNQLNDLCSRQKGLFTSAQAQERGISRTTLTRLAAYKQIILVIRGVYRSASAPAVREEKLYAAWLSLDPKKPAWDRPLNNSDFVVSRHSAAWLYGFDEFAQKPYVFASSQRKQTRNEDIRLFKHKLNPKDVVVVDGMPTITRQRTAIELLKYCDSTKAVIAFLNALSPDERPREIHSLITRREEKFSHEDAFAIRKNCRQWHIQPTPRYDVYATEVQKVTDFEGIPLYDTRAADLAEGNHYTDEELKTYYEEHSEATEKTSHSLDNLGGADSDSETAGQQNIH